VLRVPPRAASPSYGALTPPPAPPDLGAAFPPAPMKPLTPWPENAPPAAAEAPLVVPAPPVDPAAALPQEIIELVPSSDPSVVVLTPKVVPTRAPRSATEIRRIGRRLRYVAVFAAVVLVSAILTTRLARPPAPPEEKPVGSSVSTTMVITAPPSPVDPGASPLAGRSPASLPVAAPPLPVPASAPAEYHFGAAALGAMEGLAPPAGAETSQRHRKAVHPPAQVKWDPDSPFLPTEAKGSP
jgi:hypothetical protein